MIRWVIVVFVALVLINAATPWLKRIGLCRFPGDFSFRLFGRQWDIPLASSLIITAVLSVLIRAAKML